MRFFTQPENFLHNYCLYRFRRKNDWESLSRRFKEVFVDPGVYELKKSNEYRFKEELHKFVSEGIQNYPNIFCSIDYPCDMNPKYTNEFIEKSIQNNIKYADNPQ